MTITFRELLEPADGWPADDPLLHPPAHRYRWHCLTCGRFVPFATVRKVQPHGPDWVDEHEYTGECRTDGRVDVTWGQQ